MLQVRPWTMFGLVLAPLVLLLAVVTFALPSRSAVPDTDLAGHATVMLARDQLRLLATIHTDLLAIQTQCGSTPPGLPGLAAPLMAPNE